MVSKNGKIRIKLFSKEEPCGICDRKTMAYAVLRTCYGYCIQGRGVTIKRLTNRHVLEFRCTKCKGCHVNVEDKG